MAFPLLSFIILKLSSPSFCYINIFQSHFFPWRTSALEVIFDLYKSNFKFCDYLQLFIKLKSWNTSLQKQPPEVFYKKGFLTNFVKFTGKHLCQSLFFNKLHAWGVFLRILRNFFTEHLRTTPSIFHCIWLLQIIKYCFYWWKTTCVIGLNFDMKLAFSLWKDFLENVKLQ